MSGILAPLFAIILVDFPLEIIWIDAFAYGVAEDDDVHRGCLGG